MRQRLILLCSLFIFTTLNLHAQEGEHFKRFFTKGETHRKQRQYKQAIDEYVSALLISDKSAELRYYKGTCHFHLKEVDKAIEEWTKSVSIDPNYKPSYVELIKVYQSKKDLEKVISTMHSMADVEKNPTQKVNEILKISHLLIQHRKYGKALEFGKEALAIQPSNLEALYTTGQILNKTRKCEEAIGMLKKATAKVANAAPQVKSKYFYELGFAYYHCGKFTEAKSMFTQADHGPFRAKIAKLQPEYFHAVASVFNEIYDYETAESLLHNALRIDKSYVEGNLLMADIEIKQGQYHKGIPFLQEAVKNAHADASYEKVYTKLIDMMLNAKKYTEAVEYVKKGLKLFPRSRQLTFLKSIALFKSGSPQEAITEIEKLLSSSSLTSIEQAEYNFALGVFYGKAHPKEAMKALKKARKGTFIPAAQYLHEQIEEEAGNTDM